MIINSRNGIQCEDSMLQVENNDITGVKIKNTNIIVSIDLIPHISVDNMKIYYITRGNMTYVIKKDYEYSVQNAYVFEQLYKDNVLEIENIYTTTVVANDYPLITLIKYNREYEKSNLLETLPVILGYFHNFVNPNSIREQLKEVLENRLKEERPQPEQAKENKKFKVYTSRKPHAVKYNGKVYKNLKEFSNTYNMSYKMVWKHYKKDGLSLNEIINRLGGVINE